jgi:Tetratricopeptide repeat
MKNLNIKQLLLIPVIAFFYISQASAQENMGLCIRGWHKYTTGQYDQAIEDFENCIKTGNLSNDTLGRTYRNLGITFAAKKDYARAISLYNQAIDLRLEDSWNDYVNRGNAYSSIGEFQKAFADYEEALKIRPNLGAAYFNQAIVFEKMGQFEKAKSLILLGYQKGFRSPQIAERMSFYKLSTGEASSENGATKNDLAEFDKTVSEIIDYSNKKYSCIENSITLKDVSTTVRAILLHNRGGGVITVNQMTAALFTAYPCPFSPNRADLKPASKAEIEGAWVFPRLSQKLRYPPLSDHWQEEQMMINKCDGIGFFDNNEMRTATVSGAKTSCPFNTANDLEILRKFPRVASWNMIGDGRLKVSRTDVENHIEEWDIFVATSDFQTAGIQIKIGDLIGYQRVFRGNKYNASLAFWHLQKLSS